MSTEFTELDRVYLVTEGLKTACTRRNYRLGFKDFIENIVKNNDLRALRDSKPTVIENQIIKYVEFMNSKKLALSSVKVNCEGIYHFFDLNNIIINKDRIKLFYPTEESYQEDRPYTIEEIQLMLQHTDVRSRVVILLLASTGMRIGAVPALRLSNLKRIEDRDLYHITVYANSKKRRHYTFCTPECARAIDDYIGYRKRLGEKINESSFLIRDTISVDNPFTARTSRELSTRAIYVIIVKVLREAGLIELALKKEVMTSHGFRKFCINQMDRAGVQFLVREYLVNHAFPGVNTSYVRMTPEERLAEYVKAINLLTISPEGKLKQKVRELGQGREEIKAELKKEFELVPHNLYDSMVECINNSEWRWKREHERINVFIKEYNEDKEKRMKENKD